MRSAGKEAGEKKGCHGKDGLFRRTLAGFIPRHVPNAAALLVYDLLCRKGRPKPPVAFSEAAGTGVPARTAGRDGLPYIEDQRRREDERFGRSTVARAGCEVIALYNALLYLYGRETISFPALVAVFRRRGMALGGLWGTSPRALSRFLRAKALKRTLRIAVTADAARFDLLGREYPCLIMSYYNDGEDVFRGVHTVCLTREMRGFFVHNMAEDGQVRGPFPSVAGALADAPGARGLYLIGIKQNL